MGASWQGTGVTVSSMTGFAVVRLFFNEMKSIVYWCQKFFACPSAKLEKQGHKLNILTVWLCGEG